MKLTSFLLYPALIGCMLATQGGCISAPVNRDKAFDEVITLEKALNDKRPFDLNLAGQLAEKQIAFAYNFPQDSVSAQMLLNAASLRSAQGQYQASIDLFNSYLDKYPTHVRKPLALLTMGGIYENLQQTDKAKEAYERVIKEFPDTRQAKDAATLIRMLGTDLNEQIRQFEQNKND
jgi:tetratricopeptide (TPR) repeat protein